jgi:hypothetical protein
MSDAEHRIQWFSLLMVPGSRNHEEFNMFQYVKVPRFLMFQGAYFKEHFSSEQFQAKKLF